MTAPFPADPLELIPHRPPILCIDSVVFCDGEEASAHREVRQGDCWEGALIEGLAQTAAVLGAGRPGFASEPLLVGLKDLVLHRLPVPGEELRFQVYLQRALPPLALVIGHVDVVRRDGAPCPPETLAEGELKFFVGEAA